MECRGWRGELLGVGALVQCVEIAVVVNCD